MRPGGSAGRPGGRERPLGGYTVLSGSFAALVAMFITWFRRSGRELPERVAPWDLALLTVATHKLSRLIAKERVTSTLRAPFTLYQQEGGPGEVEERARGRGLRRAIGELLVCPYCLALWIASCFAAGLTVAPRATRTVASIFVAVFGSDILQIAYRRLEETASDERPPGVGDEPQEPPAKLMQAPRIG
jgi:hypothetical protein